MYCRKCGKQIDDSAKFCTFCGEPTGDLDSTVSPQSVTMENGIRCLKCHSTNVVCQREQVASVGAGTNRVVVQPAKQSKGCLYWALIGWWWKPFCFICFGWLKAVFGSRKAHGGINVNASKAITHTIAVCQNCGNSWRVR